MFCTTCGSAKNEEGICPTCSSTEVSATAAVEETVFFGDDGSGKDRNANKKRLVIAAALLVPLLGIGGFIAYDLGNKAQAKSYAQEGCTTIQKDWTSEAGDAAIKKFKLATGIDSKYKDLSNGVRKWQTADIQKLTAEIEMINIRMKILSGDYWYLSGSEIYLQYTLPQVLKKSSAQAEMDTEKDKIVKACSAL